MPDETNKVETTPSVCKWFYEWDNAFRPDDINASEAFAIKVQMTLRHGNNIYVIIHDVLGDLHMISKQKNISLW